MRSLFLLLLVINFSYLVWGVAFSEKNKVVEVKPHTNVNQKLVMLNELNLDTTSSNQQQVAKANKNESENFPLDKNLSPSIAPAKTCYSLGPILDEKESKKLQQEMKKIGFKPKHKAITDKEPKSYWVYFPVEKSLTDARAVVNQLRDANVDDYFIIRKGKFTNAISMGLYNSYGRAKIRMRKLRNLGFNPKVQTRYREVTRHWLDFQETDAKRLNTSVWENIQKDNPLQKLARPCNSPQSQSSKSS